MELTQAQAGTFTGGLWFPHHLVRVWSSAGYQGRWRSDRRPNRLPTVAPDLVSYAVDAGHKLFRCPAGTRGYAQMAPAGTCKIWFRSMDTLGNNQPSSLVPRVHASTNDARDGRNTRWVQRCAAEGGGGGEEEEFDSMSTEFNAALFISVGVYMTRT